MSACLMRMAEAGRKTLPIFANGIARRAAVGDTLMVALLTSVKTLRDSAFGGKGSTPVPPETCSFQRLAVGSPTQLVVTQP